MLEHYHKRSNVEAVFSSIKRKFGEHVRAKKSLAQENEVLCKALCYNICVLIREMMESGIKVDFQETERSLCAIWTGKYFMCKAIHIYLNIYTLCFFRIYLNIDKKHAFNSGTNLESVNVFSCSKNA